MGLREIILGTGLLFSTVAIGGTPTVPLTTQDNRSDKQLWDAEEYDTLSSRIERRIRSDIGEDAFIQLWSFNRHNLHNLDYPNITENLGMELLRWAKVDMAKARQSGDYQYKTNYDSPSLRGPEMKYIFVRDKFIGKNSLLSCSGLFGEGEAQLWRKSQGKDHTPERAILILHRKMIEYNIMGCTDQELDAYYNPTTFFGDK